MSNCQGCFKPTKDEIEFCTKCHRSLFGPLRKRVSAVLPFTRPAYEDAKRKVSGDRLSISGVQTKMSLALIDDQLQLVDTF